MRDSEIRFRRRRLHESRLRRQFLMSSESAKSVVTKRHVVKKDDGAGSEVIKAIELLNRGLATDDFEVQIEIEECIDCTERDDIEGFIASQAKCVDLAYNSLVRTRQVLQKFKDDGEPLNDAIRRLADFQEHGSWQLLGLKLAHASENEIKVLMDGQYKKVPMFKRYNRAVRWIMDRHNQQRRPPDTRHQTAWQFSLVHRYQSIDSREYRNMNQHWDDGPEYYIWDPVFSRYADCYEDYHCMAASHIVPYGFGHINTAMLFGRPRNEGLSLAYNVENGLWLRRQMAAELSKWSWVVNLEGPDDYRLCVLDPGLMEEEEKALRYIPGRWMTWKQLHGTRLKFRGDARPGHQYLYARALLALLVRRRYICAGWEQDDSKVISCSAYSTQAKQSICYATLHAVAKEVLGADSHTVKSILTPFGLVEREEASFEHEVAGREIAFAMLCGRAGLRDDVDPEELTVILKATTTTSTLRASLGMRMRLRTRMRRTVGVVQSESDISKHMSSAEHETGS